MMDFKTGSLFDELTEKDMKKAKRKAYRSVTLDKILDKLHIPKKLADVIRGLYWGC